MLHSLGQMEAEARREESWTIRRVIAWTSQHFEKKEVDSPRLTAEILLAHVLKLSRVRLYIDFSCSQREQDIQHILNAARLTGRDVIGFACLAASAFLSGALIADSPTEAGVVGLRLVVP